MPKARQITKLLLTRPDHQDADEREQLAGIRAQCAHLDALARHVTAFAEMMTGRTGTTALDNWLAAIGADDQPELHSFATGIRQDKEAVLNGLSLPYSSGRVEGTVNKIILWNQIVKSSLVGGHPGVVEERCLDRSKVLCPAEDLVRAGKGRLS